MAPGRRVVLPLLVASAPLAPSAAEWAQLVQSAGGSGDRLSRKEDVPLVQDFAFAGPVIDIFGGLDQEILGFGGAFTEAASLMFAGMPEALQEQVLEMYWGSDGLGFTLGRLPINSCDFSPRSYSFDDVDGDYGLEHFDTAVAHDRDAIIPFARAAMKKAQSVPMPGRTLRFIATPWSPPAWMKTNGKMDGSGSPCLKPEARATWAKYISKWISAYESMGVDIWAVTPQNEPDNNATWEACVFKPHEEMEWIATDLGPELKESHPEVRVFAFDHNKDDIYEWSLALYSHPVAASYASGVAFHWYTGDLFDNVERVHRSFPQATLIATEATYERYRWKPGTTLQEGDWDFALGYAHDILGDLNAGASAWMTWNLVLNMEGGPNHVDNVCDPVMLTDFRRLYPHPQFYAIGHFSKYVLVGSRRLRTSVLNTARYRGPTRPYGTCTSQDGLQAASFLRPDGRIAVVALNCGEAAVRFKLRRGGLAINATIPGLGIQTYILPASDPVVILHS